MGGSAGSTGLPGKLAFLTKSSFPAASSTKGQEPGPVVQQQQLWDRKVHCQLPDEGT